MKLSLMMAAAIGVEVVLAAPLIENVSVSRVGDFRRVAVTYDLVGEDAVVTMDIQTNAAANASGEWVSVGGKAQRKLIGAVNRKVSVGTSHSAVWCPDPSFFDGGFVSGPIRAVVTAWSVSAPPPYMVIDLDAYRNVDSAKPELAGKTPQYYPDEDSLPEGIDSDLYRTDKMVLRKIPARGVTWRMGSPDDEIGRSATMESNHLVRLTHDYYLGVFEVTQFQFKRVFGDNLSFYQSNDEAWATRPVENVHFADQLRSAGDPTSTDPEIVHEAKKWQFFQELRWVTGLGLLLDLPTEAQWEYACRAGCGAAFYDGTSLPATGVRSESLDALARNKYNGGLLNVNTGTQAPADCGTEYATARVGSYLPNAWGLYDMLGNVQEFCLDIYAAYTNAADSVSIDPPGTKSPNGRDTYRAIRGGGFASAPVGCRAASRTDNNMNVWIGSPSVGFRVAYGLGDGDQGAGDASVNELAPYDSSQRTDYWDTTGYVPTAVAKADAFANISLADDASDVSSSEVSVATHPPALVITVR